MVDSCQVIKMQGSVTDRTTYRQTDRYDDRQTKQGLTGSTDITSSKQSTVLHMPYRLMSLIHTVTAHSLVFVYS